MIVKCPNPDCGASYDVSLEKLNRKLDCKRCGTALQSHEELSSGAAAPAGPTVGPALQALGEQAMRLAPVVRERFTLIQAMADNATWAFAIGLFMIVCATLFPQLDRATVASREAAIVVGDVAEKRLDEELAAKKDKTPQDDERRTKEKERWATRKRSLEASLESAEYSRRTWPYWYRWGMLIGLTLLGGGAIAYIRPTEPPVRRILGAIVLGTIILSFIGGGVRFELGG